MRAVVQRVKRGRVSVGDDQAGEIGKGLVILLGVAHGDGPGDASFLVDKIANLRIFEDGQGKLNHSVREIEGECLVVSQFTLLADCRKGRRPSFSAAAAPEDAKSLYSLFLEELRDLGLDVEEGRFGEHMLLEIDNDGPVTLVVDSHKGL